MFRREEIEAVSGGGFIDGNRVDLLWSGPETFERILDSIRSARHIICLMFYIFRADETGRALAGHLMRKASEGVEVFVLFDHLGSFGTPLSFWRELRQAGVNVRASHPFSWNAPRRYLRRNHRKLMIVDGVQAFTGGLNIANEYSGLFRRRGGIPWRDTGVMISGPAADELLGIFARAWSKKGYREITYHPDETHSVGDIPVMPVFTQTARGRRRLRRLLYYSINHSVERIALTTAYFTPSRHMVRRLSAAVQRGVRVRLLVPGLTDQIAPHYAGRHFFERLLRAGVEIYEYHGRMMHAKSYVFDGQFCIVGSANLDFLSLRYNDEGTVGVFDRAFSGSIIDVFEHDLTQSRLITIEDWMRRSLKERILERFFSLFRLRL